MNGRQSSGVLITTYPGDLHAATVAVGLRRKGHDPVLWYGADFPTRQRGSIAIDGTGHSWTMLGEELDERSSPFDVVWLRRPGVPTLGGEVLAGELHPGDRKIAERACTAFYRAFWNLVAPDAFWINPLASRSADIKPLQLVEAARLGLAIPPTLCSNDPERIRSFLAEHRGRAIYKSFVPAQWETEAGVAHLFTSAVGLEDLPEDELLQISAGIFQRRIDKQYEVRVTAIGERLFAAKLHSQDNELAREDWRRAYGTLRLEAMALPPEIAARCVALMRRLGIVFGCFDFIVTERDEYVFLEVNPMGQFLWVEEGDPSILLADAFCELIIQARSVLRLAGRRRSPALRRAPARSDGAQGRGGAPPCPPRGGASRQGRSPRSGSCRCGGNRGQAESAVM